jgi:hypothetical protein
MIRGMSCRAHRLSLAASLALLVLSVAFAGCHKETSPAEVGKSPPVPSAAPPVQPSSVPSGVFVHRDRAQSANGEQVDFYSILRFGQDGQVCNVNVSAELDDEALSRYSKSCDAHEKDREYGKYTFMNGTITFSLGESDYSGVFDKDRLILNTVYRPSQKSSTDEYRHYDVSYDKQEQQSRPSEASSP